MLWNSRATSPYVSSAWAIASRISSWFRPPTDSAYMKDTESASSMLISRLRDEAREYGTATRDPKPSANPTAPKNTAEKMTSNGCRSDERTSPACPDTFSRIRVPVSSPTTKNSTNPTVIPRIASMTPLMTPIPIARERYISTVSDIRDCFSFFWRFRTNSLSSLNSRL